MFLRNQIRHHTLTHVKETEKLLKVIYLNFKNLKYKNIIIKKTRLILLVIQKMVEDAENEWIEQLKTKDEQINSTRNKYNQNSRQLLEAQRTMQWCRSQERECDETETKIKFL